MSLPDTYEVVANREVRIKEAWDDACSNLLKYLCFSSANHQLFGIGSQDRVEMPGFVPFFYWETYLC
jgi:hypothetical protein